MANKRQTGGAHYGLLLTYRQETGDPAARLTLWRTILPLRTFPRSFQDSGLIGRHWFVRRISEISPASAVSCENPSLVGR